MNKKITEAFAKGKAFIPFVTCGDPSLDVTEKIVYAMEEAGADLIELGIPFSDPTAEGPVIQGANLRALSGGVTTDKVFDMVEKIRKNSSIPMVFMTYANVVFSYGIERFCKRAAEVGMDGMILPDVPFEEKEEFASVAEKYGLDLISLIAPTSHDRIRMIAKEASGFIYCVSSLGVTGTRSAITTDIGAMVGLVSSRLLSELSCRLPSELSCRLPNSLPYRLFLHGLLCRRLYGLLYLPCGSTFCSFRIQFLSLVPVFHAFIQLCL